MLHSGTKSRFVIGWNEPLIDEPVSLYLTGVKPGQLVRLSASSTDGQGTRYSSWAEYEASREGVVDPARQCPLAGTYHSSDPFGLWWSMTSKPERPFAHDLRSIPTSVTADVADEPIAEIEFKRLRVGLGVTVEPVHDDGLVGTLFLPESSPAPGVVVLGGSEGGLSQSEELAALLATRGFAALALAYFAMDGLPAHLVDIPLEYLEAAILWLVNSLSPSCQGVGVVGTSRGAELALLLASICPQVRAVVGFAASNVIWPGFEPGATRAHPAWTRKGVGLPFAVPVPGPSLQLGLDHPLVMKTFFQSALEDQHQISKAKILVERIQGTVLLISGGDDKLWPSQLMAEMVMSGLVERNPPFPDLHLTYPQAGHTVGRLLGLPASPTTIRLLDGLSYELGGTKAANARSADDAWPRVLTFLWESLKPSSAPSMSSLGARSGTLYARMPSDPGLHIGRDPRSSQR